MIPEWSTNGDLPPGVHFATWREIEDRLNFNPRRQRLFASRPREDVPFHVGQAGSLRRVGDPPGAPVANRRAA